MKLNLIVLAALFSASQAYKLQSVHRHPADFLDDSGEETSTSLIDNADAKPIEITNVLLQTKDGDDDTPEKAREKFALMQADMEAKVQAADEKKA